MFLTAKAPFPVDKLIEDTTIVRLLLTTEPGPKVGYDALRTNLTLLEPFVTNTSSGPALLAFFESLLQSQARWLIAAAKLEAFRSYDRTLLTYYVEWYEGFRQDTATRVPNEGEIAYESECQEHAANRLAGTYAQQEELLVQELQAEAINLVRAKTSQDMWKYGRILSTITDQYKRYKQRTKSTAAAQKKWQEEETKKMNMEEILRRRVETKKNNGEIQKRQMGMQQQHTNNVFMQQDWMSNHAPES